jgi:hypothetical protein
VELAEFDGAQRMRRSTRLRGDHLVPGHVFGSERTRRPWRSIRMRDFDVEFAMTEKVRSETAEVDACWRRSEELEQRRLLKDRGERVWRSHHQGGLPSHRSRRVWHGWGLLILLIDGRL